MDLLNRHRLIASDLVRKWSRAENVLGVVGLGGLARGTVDEFSDIDLALFVQSRRRNRIPAGEFSYKGVDVDVMIFEYDSELGALGAKSNRKHFPNIFCCLIDTGESRA